VSDKRPPPAFQFYASDTIADEAFKLLSLEERGLWITMLAQCWVNGSVPADPTALGKVLGLEAGLVSRSLSPVSQLFGQKEGRFYSADLERQRDMYAERQLERQRAGRKGARQRWSEKPKGGAGKAGAMAAPRAKPMAESLPESQPLAIVRGEGNRAEAGRGEASGKERLSSAESILETVSYDSGFRDFETGTGG